VGLTGFKCRCGGTFCGSHRHAEDHECTFDFAAEGKARLAESNPLVQAAKVDRI
jgi:predicted nucleic acid binding AN1-type Zn finger protein